MAVDGVAAEPADFSAALGRQLDLAVLMKRFAAIPLREFLMDCANAAVLESQGNTWHFAHGKLRESILRRQSQAERTALHGQVAEALESVYQGPPSMTLDRLTQARVRLDRLKKADADEPQDRLRMARIDCETGTLYTFLNQETQAAACFERMLPIADAFQDQQLAAMARMMYGRKLAYEGKIARAITMLEPSIPTLERQIGMGWDVARGYSYLAILTVADEFGNEMEALQTEIAWAQVCLDRHDLAAASTLFRKARDRITTPLLARVGELDAAAPPKHSQETVRAVPDGTLEIVPGVGHALTLEDLEGTTESVKRFLLTEGPG